MPHFNISLTCCFLFGSSADTAVDVDINNAVDNNGMAVNFGGSPFFPLRLAQGDDRELRHPPPERGGAGLAALSERLAQEHPMAGAELLCAFLNRYFTLL